MTTVVADTNVYVSALAFGGLPERLLRLAEIGVFRLAISAPILGEIEQVLVRDKFGWPEEQVTKALRQISRFTVAVVPKATLNVIQADASD